MGTITAKSIIDRAAIVLEDTGNVTYTRAELLAWLNEGQNQVVGIAPWANTVRETASLTAGTTQTLPARCNVLMDVPRNVNGAAIRRVSRELLDAGPFDWHTTTATAAVQNFVYDPNEPQTFLVFPPNTGTGQVTVVYGAVPAVITSEETAIEVQDRYDAALVNYVLFRAYSKDTNFVEGGAQKATAHFAAFKDAVGVAIPGNVK